MAARISRIIAAVLVTGLGVAPLNAQPGGPGPRRSPDREVSERRTPGEKREGPPRRPGGPRADSGRLFGPGFLGGPEFDRMLRLAFSSEEDVRAAMEQIPGLANEGPEERNRMLRRLESFRRMLREQALRAAAELDLTVAPDREREFVESYWRARASAERTLREEMEPRRRQLMERMEQELKEKFGAR